MEQHYFLTKRQNGMILFFLICILFFNSSIVFSAEESKNIVLSDYTISIPLQWDFQVIGKKETEVYFLLENGKSAGGIQIAGGKIKVNSNRQHLEYRYDKTISNYYGSGAEEILQEKLNNFKYDVTKVILQKKVQENKQPIKELHYYFLVEISKDNVYYYDLYFNLDTVKQEEAEEIAKSLNLNDKFLIARQWALAFENRNGKLSYPTMSESLKKKFLVENEFRKSDDNFVIGWSSPWVIGYEIKVEENKAVITYTGETSEPMVYHWQDILYFGEQNGKTVVVKSDTTEFY